MKKLFTIIAIFLFFFIFISADYSIPSSTQFKDGEYLKYRIHYGFLNAGYATFTTHVVTFNDKPHYHVVGKGYSTGAVKLFFKVEDLYETYIDKSTMLSSKFIRNIREGSYVRDQTMRINHTDKKITYTNNKSNTTKTYNYTGEMHDMLSAFYYLRNMNTDNYNTGDYINLNIFMDGETLNFKLKILNREDINSSFGKVRCLKIRPYVLAGRVFKEKESVTMWVTDDSNHVPIQVKAELAVGSLKADLSSFKNLETPINFTK
ncbi:Protein of unknown function (DUF3108) [Apibacter mensalis]|uniref:DUF3108 domain-containing protein n=1 Tax=Apibacter mensalis TaxID=1586267 RepID=A0A0X3AQL5_9FLAO|nr:DUF3108 domain-containing protein [Apibacter mensalis]CVK16661.1 Protein of unknown function (DUF3108) [Apibacter mensalis]